MPRCRSLFRKCALLCALAAAVGCFGQLDDGEPDDRGDGPRPSCAAGRCPPGNFASALAGGAPAPVCAPPAPLTFAPPLAPAGLARLGFAGCDLGAR